MSNPQGLELNFKIGILKELHKRQFISRAEMDKAIKIIITSMATQG
jgi:hypothetical protein